MHVKITEIEKLQECSARDDVPNMVARCGDRWQVNKYDTDFTNICEQVARNALVDALPCCFCGTTAPSVMQKQEESQGMATNGPGT